MTRPTEYRRVFVVLARLHGEHKARLMMRETIARAAVGAGWAKAKHLQEASRQPIKWGANIEV